MTLLSTTQRAVLEAMTLPDPRPPHAVDSPAAAIHRREPAIGQALAAAIVTELNTLGMTNVPYVNAAVPPAMLADLRRWITPKGWKTLGMPGDVAWWAE
ncbi:MAG TPA: hypothetical protein VMT19_02805 [Thermoanaerobaculaceae bacterium]|nr:hypothetical protein [Thermoanaerobaculaceae bacterium]